MNRNTKKASKEINRLRQQLQKDPSLPGFMSLLEKLMDSDNYLEALSIADEAILKFNEHPTLLIAKAKVLIELEETEQADIIITGILEVNPENLVAKKLKSKIHEIPTEKTGSEDPSDDAENTSTEGGYRALNNGDTELALNIFKRILEDNPDDQQAKQGFMQAYAATVKAEKLDDDIDIDEVDRQSAVILKTIEILEYWKKANRSMRKDRRNHQSG